MNSNYSCSDPPALASAPSVFQIMGNIIAQLLAVHDGNGTVSDSTKTAQPSRARNATSRVLHPALEWTKRRLREHSLKCHEHPRRLQESRLSSKLGLVLAFPSQPALARIRSTMPTRPFLFSAENNFSLRGIQIAPAVRSATSGQFSDHSHERPYDVVNNDHFFDHAVGNGLLRGTNCGGVAVSMNTKPVFVKLAFFRLKGPAAYPANHWKMSRTWVGVHTRLKWPPLHGDSLRKSAPPRRLATAQRLQNVFRSIPNWELPKRHSLSFQTLNATMIAPPPAIILLRFGYGFYVGMCLQA